jgi:acetylornithine/LysW-gamma-L-lysine aminotransferase
VEDKLYPVEFVQYGNIEDMSRAVTEETAAVILEPVQGEGGVHLPPKDYFRDVKRICEERGALLIVDEVQSGLCRSGKMFAIMHHEVTPDIMCVGKSLGGGLPIGATVINGKLGTVPKGSHGSTFGGAPLVCAAANGTLRYMVENELQRRSMELGKIFMEGLEDLESSRIREVRGIGLMIGLELKTRAGPYLSSLLEKGIAAIPTGATVIRFLPPLVVEEEDIQHTLKCLAEVLNG